MTDNIGDKHEHFKFRYAVMMTISFVMLMWFVKALEFAGSTSYSKFGILPRTLKGSVGIMTGPLIHGDFMHLFSNTLPFLFWAYCCFTSTIKSLLKFSSISTLPPVFGYGFWPEAPTILAQVAWYMASLPSCFSTASLREITS
jgi:hypothetical protein